MNAIHALRKRRFTTLISIYLLMLFISPFAVSGHIFDFEDGMGSGWNFGGDKCWCPDSVGHDSNFSMKSGEIDCKGTSSIYRNVTGTGTNSIRISFWWKKGGSAITNFTFSIDGRVERTCYSYDWEQVVCDLPNDSETHELRWDFEKETCHLQGSGWIDDVSDTLTTFELNQSHVISWPQSEPGQRGELGHACDLYVGPCDDLQSIISNSADKVICLEAGIYNLSKIIIETNNITIKPVDGCDVILDGAGESYIIALDTVSNVSIIGLTLINCNDCLYIENCTDCIIEGNQLLSFKSVGISMRNDSSCIIRHNKINTNYTGTTGLILNESLNNSIWYNNVNVKDHLIYLENSCNNTIYDANTGTIREDIDGVKTVECSLRECDVDHYVSDGAKNISISCNHWGCLK